MKHDIPDHLLPDENQLIGYELRENIPIFSGAESSLLKGTAVSGVLRKSGVAGVTAEELTDYWWEHGGFPVAQGEEIEEVYVLLPADIVNEDPDKVLWVSRSALPESDS